MRVYRRFSFDSELSCTDVIFQEYNTMMRNLFSNQIEIYRPLFPVISHSFDETLIVHLALSEFGN